MMPHTPTSDDALIHEEPCPGGAWHLARVFAVCSDCDTRTEWCMLDPRTVRLLVNQTWRCGACTGGKP